MKKLYSSIVHGYLLLILLFGGCSENRVTKKTDISSQPVATKVKKPVVISDETSLLLKDLKENGDYVNSQVFPSLIKASIVYESLGKNILVIDLRTQNQFSEGHIKGAVNKKFTELPLYFEKGIKPFTYDKIIMVCEDGQVSSYTTSLLRLMGYGNVYAMRWGMSAWNKKFAQEAWLKGVSGKFESKLENTINQKGDLKGMPELKTGMTTGEEIGSARFRKL
jgi:rhodanese-related sulfurtransferase